MKRSVSCGSCPSKPTTIIRLIFGVALVRLVSARHSMRNGQINSDRNATSIVVNSTMKLVTKAKPAPGPT